MRRIQPDDHQRRCDGLLDRDSVICNVDRQLGSSLRLAHLREDLIGIRIGLHVEVHDHGHLPVRGVQRVHVVQIVHAAHLLFDGRCNGLLDGLRIRANVVGLNLHFRRSDARELRHGKGRDGDRADDDHQNGDHHRNDRPVDKEVATWITSPFADAVSTNGLGLTCSAGTDLHGAVGDDTLSGLQAIVDDPQRADSIADLDILDGDFVVDR